MNEKKIDWFDIVKRLKAISQAGMDNHTRHMLLLSICDSFLTLVPAVRMMGRRT
jgi:hypothetical protein